MRRERSVPADTRLAAIEQTLQRVFEIAAGTGARLTAFTLGKAFVVPAFPDLSDRVCRLNAITRRLAADHDAVLVDVNGG